MPCVAPETRFAVMLRTLELSAELPALNASIPAFAAPVTVPVATTDSEPAPSFRAHTPKPAPETDPAVIDIPDPLASLKAAIAAGFVAALLSSDVTPPDARPVTAMETAPPLALRARIA